MPKATHATPRSEIRKLSKVCTAELVITEDSCLLGITSPRDLIGVDPVAVYQRLNHETRTFHDPCVLEVFLAAIDFMTVNPPRVWWKYPEQRKANYSTRIDELRSKCSRAWVFAQPFGVTELAKTCMALASQCKKVFSACTGFRLHDAPSEWMLIKKALDETCSSMTRRVASKRSG